MRSKDIKVGRVYEGRDLAQRFVKEIGPGLRGVPAPNIPQVVFTDLATVTEGYRYIDTFARWAVKEVK